MVNMTGFFDRPQNKKMSPRPKPLEHNSEQCPTPQNRPTHTAKPPVSPIKSHRNEIQGPSQIKEEYPMVGQLVLEGSHPG